MFDFHERGSRSQDDRPRPVALVGCGTVGVPVAQLVAMAGIAVGLIDPDVVSTPNLVRQLYRAQDVGRFKVECLMEALRSARPALVIEAMADDCRNLGAGVYGGFRTVLACIDSLEVERWLGSLTRLLGIGMIRPATTGRPGGSGSATVRAYPPDSGACPECWFGPEEYAMVSARAPCDDLVERNPTAGVFQSAEDGYLAAGLALKTLLHQPTGACKRQITGSFEALDSFGSDFRRRESCCGEHAPVPLEFVDSSEAKTLGSLFRLAAARLGAEPHRTVLDADLHPLVLEAACSACRSLSHPSFLRYPLGSSKCSHCGSILDVERIYKDVSLGTLGACEALTLSSLKPPLGWAGYFRLEDRGILLCPRNGGL